jgi:TPP-dependent 2-oxoacid decarboxylase
MGNVAESIIDALAELGVTHVWGVVGDALNPVTDAIRRESRIEWIGVRHEEAAAFAAGAQAQLTSASSRSTSDRPTSAVARTWSSAWSATPGWWRPG